MGRITQITSGNYDGVNGFDWTPDGKIIYTAQTGDNQNLWVIDQDGNNRQQLTAGAGNNRSPTVSPDGRHVVFVSDRTGTRYLWKMNLDGSQPVQLTNFQSDRIFWFDWSSDGKSLASARGLVHHDVVMISDLQ